MDGAAFSPCTSPLNFANLSEGPHSFHVRARDAAGNPDPTPATFSWAIDLSVPAAPVITTPADGALIAEPQPVFSGTAQPASTVTLTLDGTVAGTTTTADASGTWSFTPDQALSEGEHLATATSNDGGGTSSASTPVHFTVDTTPETPEPPETGGCDCAAGSGDASWLLTGLALLARIASRRLQPRLR